MAKYSATIPGSLYIVATPIGNLQDISLRAIAVLNKVDLILAEDTRHSLPLLRAIGIQKPVLSLHAHNELEKSRETINAMQQGQSFALISDAGTPLISDPGFPLVRLARENNLQVIPIPGPCALITALSAAGLPCEQFSFLGFLPAKSKARQDSLKQILKSEHTVVFYESTHRVLACVADIIAIFNPHYQFVLAKELTKTFERFLSGTGLKIKAWLEEDKAHIKGEFVFMLPPSGQAPLSQDEQTLAILLKELPLKQAVKLAALLTNLPKNKIYAQALQLQGKNP